MSKKNQQPETWSVPDWHPDLGDAHRELEDLRGFAVALLAALPGARVELETPEPGLMYLDVQTPDGSTVEVYSVVGNVVSGRRRLGLFFSPGTRDEDEVYADAIDGALRYCIQWADRKAAEGTASAAETGVMLNDDRES